MRELVQPRSRLGEEVVEHERAHRIREGAERHTETGLLRGPRETAGVVLQRLACRNVDEYRREAGQVREYGESDGVLGSDDWT